MVMRVTIWYLNMNCSPCEGSEGGDVTKDANNIMGQSALGATGKNNK